MRTSRVGRTDYIDPYIVHSFNFVIPLEEITTPLSRRLR